MIVLPAKAASTPADERATDSDTLDYTVKAVERVCSIFELLQESTAGASLTDVAEATGLHRATAYRYLWTLEKHRYAERDPHTDLFRLGLGFVGMQSRQLELLREKAHPWVEKLRDELGETISLGLLDGNEIIYVDVVESARAVRLAAHRGDRDPVHATALGKAITSRIPEDRVRQILAAAGMERLTEHTIADPDRFINELDRVRRTGYAVDDRESDIDGRCVAVALPGTRLPAALSYSAPSSRFPQREIRQVADRLHEAADQIASDAGRI